MELTGREVLDRDGEQVGELEQVYRAQGSDELTWGVVKAGRGKRHWVPLGGVQEADKDVRVPVSRSQIEGGPSLERGETLSPEVEQRLARHFEAGARPGGRSAGATSSGSEAERPVDDGERRAARSRTGRDRDEHAARPRTGHDRDEAREQFGGINWGAAVFGWFVFVGVAVLLTALLGAAGAAVGLTGVSGGQARQQAGTAGLVGAIVLLVVLMVAYYAGGYVAGRMSRFDGGKQGFAVWVVGILVTIVLAVAGTVLGAQFNVLAQLNLPTIPVGGDSLATGGAIAFVVILIGTVLAAIGGGKAGQRYHRKVDEAG